MNLDALVSLVTQMLAISLAAERLVTFFKSSFPALLSAERRSGPVGEDPIADGPRRALVIMLAFLASYACAALVANQWLPFGRTAFGGGEGKVELPIIVVALLATGGSAFWKNLLDYTQAVKDIRGQMSQDQSLALQQKAVEAGLPMNPADRKRLLPDDAPAVRAAQAQLGAKPQPSFN